MKMKPINLYSKEIIVLCVFFILVSCKKETDPMIPPPIPVETLTPTGFWKLKSVTLGKHDREQLNTFYEVHSFPFMTSCSTQLTLHDSTALHGIELSIYSHEYYVYISSYVNKYLDLDSTYNACLPQYLLDTMSYTSLGDCVFDTSSITFKFDLSPGGGVEIIKSRTYNVMELTDSTLKISGPYPMPSLSEKDTGTFTFSK